MLKIETIDVVDERTPEDRVLGRREDLVARRLGLYLAPRDALEIDGETIDFFGARGLATLPGLAELLDWLGHRRRPDLDDGVRWAEGQGGALAYARPAAWPEAGETPIAPGLTVESCDATLCIVRAGAA